jgi:hypothetical protein
MSTYRSKNKTGGGIGTNQYAVRGVSNRRKNPQGLVVKPQVNLKDQVSDDRDPPGGTPPEAPTQVTVQWSFGKGQPEPPPYKAWVVQEDQEEDDPWNPPWGTPPKAPIQRVPVGSFLGPQAEPQGLLGRLGLRRRNGGA